jgi:three-Cys-motif partner protein
VPQGDGRRQNRRTWGYWTEQKLSILADYLPAFTTASQSSRKTLYLDLFAGEDRNLSRTTGNPINGSPRVALNTMPAFSKVVLFELPAQAARLEAQLRADYEGRDFEVVPGDCNVTLAPLLRDLSSGGWDWAPTFALVDQYAAEVRWSTLEQLARFKRLGRSKVELWLLFAPSMLPRGLASEDAGAIERFAGRITNMYGTEEWRQAYAARQFGRLNGSGLRDELLNLMRWRLEDVLGYRVTHSFGMKNTRGREIYNMVFATDHPAGERIMNHIYGKAAEAQPFMQAEAAAKVQAEKEERSGVVGLFPPPPKPVESVKLYQHRPPWPPYELADELADDD